MNDHMDGFDHRGTGTTGRDNMLNGIYSEITISWQPSAAQPRTGPNSMFMTTLGVTRSVIRRFFKTEGSKKFMGAAWFIPAMPDQSYRWAFCQFVTAANDPIMSFTLSTTGQLQILLGDTASASGGEVVLVESDPGAFVPGIFQHVECMGDVDGGAAEVRVNGVVACSITGVDFGVTPIAQWTCGRPRTNNDNVNDVYLDDLRVGDDQGGVNDDFMGDRRVFTDMSDADGATQEFTPSAGSDAFAMVDEIPQDGDATYVESSVVGDICQLAFPALPAGIAQINGIAFEAVARKTDVGVAALRINANSGGTQSLGDEQALNLVYETIPIQNFDEDPDIAGPWTPTTVNAALCELDHSS